MKYWNLNDSFSVSLSGNLPHEAPQIHKEVKDGDGIQKDNKA